MTTNRLTRSTTFSRFSYSCTVTDASADGIAVVRVDVLTEFILDANADRGVMIDIDDCMFEGTMLDVALGMLISTDIIFGTDADIFNDENINGLAALMTPSKLSLSPLCEDSMSLC